MRPEEAISKLIGGGDEETIRRLIEVGLISDRDIRDARIAIDYGDPDATEPNRSLDLAVIYGISERTVYRVARRLPKIGGK